MSYKKYTKSEKEQFIKQFKESGLSKLQWCKENNIALSTFSRWCKNPGSKPEFLELKKQSEMSEKTSANNSDLKITFEFSNCRVSVPIETGTEIIKSFLRAGV